VAFFNDVGKRLIFDDCDARLKIKVNWRQILLGLYSALCGIYFQPLEAFAEDVLRFTSPSPWQVVQRESANSGVVVVAGTAPEGGSSIELLLTNGHKSLIAHEKSGLASGQAFSIDLTIPAGGWYSLAARVRNASQQIIAVGQVSPIGVGEVFVAAGQSNSNNCCGESPQKATSKLVSGGFLINGSDQPPVLRWSETIDGGPLAPGGSTTGGGGGPWPAFASRLAERLHLPVAVVQIGCGGTTSQDWLPNEPMQPIPDLTNITYKPEIGLWTYSGTAIPDCGADAKRPGALYNRLAVTAKQLAKFRAVLWDQGESDMLNIFFTRAFSHWQVPQQPGDYFSHMATIIARLNKDTGVPVHWLVAQASYMSGFEVDPATCIPNGKPWQYQKMMDPVIADQQALVAKGLALAGPSTDILVGAIPRAPGKTYRYAGPTGRCLHFSNAGLTELGDAWQVAVWHSHLLPVVDSHSNRAGQ
jgi:hypothetical protein